MTRALLCFGSCLLFSLPLLSAGCAEATVSGSSLHLADDAALVDVAATPDITAEDVVQPDTAEAEDAGADLAEEPDVPEPPVRAPADVRGRINIFGPPGGPLAGAEVFILEHPELRVTSDEDGRFEFKDVPGGDVTLVMQAEDFPENQLGTHLVDGVALEQLNFQAVSQTVYDVFAALTESVPDHAMCQISTTITRWFEGSLPQVHGEPGVTDSITPDVPKASGPIYFSADVLPTPGLTETTVDGGIVWVNVPPGDYVLHAHKDAVTFKDVRIHCRAGVLVNAGPPWGLQALNAGSGY